MKDHNSFTAEERNAALAFAENMGLVRAEKKEEVFASDAMRFANAMGLQIPRQKEEKPVRRPEGFGKAVPALG